MRTYISAQNAVFLAPLYTIDLQSSLNSLKEYALCSQSLGSSALADDTKKEDYGPWSHAPVCTSILPSINDKLCVYTDTSFAQNRGISIFTTPSLAKDFASLPAFRDASALVSQSINKPTDSYHATSIPGKGIGMLASRPLKFGERVTAYTPAFLAYLESELSTLDREALWRTAIEQLPSDLKEKFLGLATVYGDPRVQVQDIVKANTFQVMLNGVNHLAVWPETSRLNHACAPNAQYVIDTDLLSHTVRVTRPIAEGEEITISYTSPLEPTETRQHHLAQGFHFTCTCPRCSSPITDITLSIINDLQAQLNDWSDASLGSPQVAEELLILYREEGLEGFMDTPYGFAALAYSAVGDAEMAVRYAEMARAAVLMKDGKGARNLGIWEEMIRGVRKHWSWRRRA
ncbi:hypothetical protein J3E74DRAFT_445268 [Bipolaris maydis]|nr:hypothetical protein J3E74DRAFT_445268 [Bipolaris maydis]